MKKTGTNSKLQNSNRWIILNTWQLSRL